MKIPRRIHCTEPLPGDAAWIITEEHGQLVVYLAADIPEGSPLEQMYVRQAVRAWQRDHQDRLLGLLPIFAGGGAGLGWLIKQARRPAIATGTAVVTVAGVALAAATLTDPPNHPAPRRPPAAEAPPSQTPARKPSPPRSTKPRPQPPVPSVRPQEPEADLDTSASVSVTGVGRVHVPPVRVRPPVAVPTPPVKAPALSPRPPRPGCRLVRVEVGKLVKVCL